MSTSAKTYLSRPAMRLRFTIRDLLWLTLVVALIVGWWLEHRAHRRLIRENESTVAEMISHKEMEEAWRAFGITKLQELQDLKSSK